MNGYVQIKLCIILSKTNYMTFSKTKMMVNPNITMNIHFHILILEENIEFKSYLLAFKAFKELNSYFNVILLRYGN